MNITYRGDRRFAYLVLLLPLILVMKIVIEDSQEKPRHGIPIPAHKPYAPLSEHRINDCKDRIAYNEYQRKQGSVQRLPVSADCDRI